MPRKPDALLHVVKRHPAIPSRIQGIQRRKIRRRWSRNLQLTEHTIRDFGRQYGAAVRFHAPVPGFGVAGSV
jgi:hypothetical protein